MTVLHAQPYHLSATGFYFETVEEYAEKASALRNDYGEPVEEFEIQFIDGEAIDAALASALGLHQGDVAAIFAKIDEWDEHQKRAVIIAVGECGYSVSWESCDPDGFDVDLYQVDSLRELAEQFVDEGLFGDIPERIACYLKYDAIARDLGMDYAETTIAGERFVYHCG